MKKQFLTVFTVSSSIIAFAQSGVGVNTPNPTETSDVNGTERIRVLPINGSSNAIYTKPDGTKSNNKDQTFTATKTVVADKNGVLGTMNWIPSETPIVYVGTDRIDAVPYSSTVSTKNGVTITTPVLASKTFTLSKKSLVTFSFSVSASSIHTYSGALLQDGASKRFGAKLLLDSVGIINSGLPFSNSAANYADGFFYLDGTRTLLLGSGTYKVDLVGSVFAYDADDVGIRATFGATADDQLDIVAVAIP